MSLEESLVGSVVQDRYRLLERVGGGGMGHVFRAEDTVTGRTVAIKLLYKELWSNADVTARLFQEARVVTSIAHPNIVEILAVDRSEHGPFIAMEFLDGSSVGSLLQTMGRFDEDVVVTIVIPLLSALAAAHQCGVVHRDLKPENIFVCRERTGRNERGTVHLLDFGIAKLQESATEGPLTRTGVVFGTPDYLSPEQASGEGALDGRSDLFSVGIVMYELLSGRRPFTASTAVATAFRIVHATPPSFESLGVTVSVELRGIIRKLLAKSPADRPSSAREVLDVLQQLSPDSDSRQLRLLRLLQDAEDKRRRGSRPPPIVARSKTSPALGVDGLGVRTIGLSPRTAGRCTRGPVLASIDGSIERMFGEIDRERVVALLPDSHAEELRRGRPSVLDAHDVDVVRRYVDTASRVLSLRDDVFVSMGRDAVRHELGPFVRTLTAPTDLADGLPRVVTIVKALFDFGTWSLQRADRSQPGGRAFVVTVSGFELASHRLRLWLVGVLTQIVELQVGHAVPIVELRSTETELVLEIAPG
jgi:serine/threonine protein kinase